MNHSFQYHRLVLGYHGCDQSVADRVLAGETQLQKSEKPHDWLGHGIYFWEHGPQRALEWAQQQKAKNKNIRKPAVLGAVIHLGNCLDLLDTHCTQILSEVYPRFKAEYERQGKMVPKNRSTVQGEKDQLLRYLDCAVIDWLTSQFEITSGVGAYDSVRGMFQEHDPVYEGSSVHMKSHIQIAIRNPACILGYFRPVF